MSKQIVIDLHCPHCKEHGKAEVWDSVNVDVNPELRDKVFSGELFLWECPHCGYKMLLPFDTLYHDMKHKFMLFFSFDDKDVEDKYAPVKMPNAPEVLSDEYTIRWVYGFDNFREKIVLLELGLDDVVIERMKYMQSHIVHPEIAEKGYHLLLGGVNREDEELSEYGSIFFIFRDDEGKTMHIVLPMDMYYEHRLACEIDPRMKLGDCRCVDEGWISRQLKSHKV